MYIFQCFMRLRYVSIFWIIFLIDEEFHWYLFALHCKSNRYLIPRILFSKGSSEKHDAANIAKKVYYSKIVWISVFSFSITDLLNLLSMSIFDVLHQMFFCRIWFAANVTNYDPRLWIILMCDFKPLEVENNLSQNSHSWSLWPLLCTLLMWYFRPFDAVKHFPQDSHL